MDKKEFIEQKVGELLKKLGFESTTIEVVDEEGKYMVNLATENDASALIGKYGETLGALQRICEVMMFKHFNEEVLVLVNINDYRQKQKERIEGIAENVAERVTADQKTVPLSGFSSFERKIIHEYVTTNYPELTTISEGEGRDRTINISIKS